MLQSIRTIWRKLFTRESPVEQKTPEWYCQEFTKLSKHLWNKHHIDYDTHDTLLYSMDSIHHELEEMGGYNWNHGDYPECLENVRQILLAHSGFTDDQLEEIRRCTAALGKKNRHLRCLEIDYLLARTVDWCHANQKNDEVV